MMASPEHATQKTAAKLALLIQEHMSLAGLSRGEREINVRAIEKGTAVPVEGPMSNVRLFPATVSS
jgi:hypothetical protein